MTARWLPRLHRRRLLAYLAAGFAVGYGGRAATAGAPVVVGWQSLYAELHADPERLALGRAFAARFPGTSRQGFERLAKAAIGGDAGRLPATTLRARIRDRAAMDFRSGRIEQVDGWRLSHLEAVLLAAAVT